MRFAKKEKKPETLEELIVRLRGKYGEKAIMLGKDVKPPRRWSTGIEELDRITGGGWPEGRIIEIWGPEKAGKTTLVLKSIAAMQQKNPGAYAAYFDLENTFMPDWAKKCGVDLNRFIHIKAMAAEDMGNLAVRFIRRKWSMVAIDSVVEILPSKVLERGLDEEVYAPQARMLSVMLPKIVVLQSRSPTVVLLVNQVRDKIGFHMGDDLKQPGGHALAHLVSFLIKVQRKKQIKVDDRVLGFEMALRILKTKLSIEGEECRCIFKFGKGIVG